MSRQLSQANFSKFWGDRHFSENICNPQSMRYAKELHVETSYTGNKPLLALKTWSALTCRSKPNWDSSCPKGDAKFWQIRSISWQILRLARGIIQNHRCCFMVWVRWDIQTSSNSFDGRISKFQTADTNQKSTTSWQIGQIYPDIIYTSWFLIAKLEASCWQFRMISTSFVAMQRPVLFWIYLKWRFLRFTFRRTRSPSVQQSPSAALHL